MSVFTDARLDIVPLSRHIGAEVRGLDLREKPDGRLIETVYRAAG